MMIFDIFTKNSDTGSLENLLGKINPEPIISVHFQKLEKLETMKGNQSSLSAQQDEEKNIRTVLKNKFEQIEKDSYTKYIHTYKKSSIGTIQKTNKYQLKTTLLILSKRENITYCTHDIMFQKRHD